MNLTSRCVFLLVACVTAVTVSAEQNPDVLDLTQPRQSTGVVSQAPGKGSALGIAAHSVREKAPFELVVGSIDRDSYKPGESFVIRIRLRNISPHVIVAPWEPDRTTLAAAAPEKTIQWLLSLMAQAPNGSHVAIPLALLYGNEEAAGTTRSIKPGRSVEIVVPAEWRFVPMIDFESDEWKLPRRIEVRTRLAVMQTTDKQAFEDVVSANQIPVLLTR